MALLKLKDFDPNYRETLGNDGVIDSSVYSDITDEKIGSVKDILVDETSGKFRYLIVDLGFWIFGKKVLLPIGISRIDSSQERVYAKGLTKEQAKNLPEFNDDLKIDYDYEERVRGIYRTPATDTLVNPIAPVAPYDPMGLNTVAALDVPSGIATPGVVSQQPGYTANARDTYDYENESYLYGINDTDHQSIKLYEERLIANKKRTKTGEVEIGKHVETEIARVSVPVEKERIVIERVTPQDAGKSVAPGETAFREGEVAHMEIYKEIPDIRKEAVLREEVRIRKEVEQDTVEAQETLRREELDVDTQGRPVVDKND